MTGLRRHEYSAGEVFEYFYEVSEATYATEPDHNGRAPRITDLQRIEEACVRVRIAVVDVEGRRHKRAELRDLQLRERTLEELHSGRPVPYRAVQEVLAGFPAEVEHTYPVGGDGAVAGRLLQIFGEHADMRLMKLVDIFSFTANVESIPADIAVSEGRIQPAVDVDLAGAAFHNHHRIVLFDRIDRRHGVDLAYLKVQSPGNFFDAAGVETVYQLTCAVALEGPATGLVTDGELQELVFIGTDERPLTAMVRQVSMTMQSEHVCSSAATR